MAGGKAPKVAEKDAKIDRHVGAWVRARRLLLGLTMEGLAEQIGVTFEQVSRYERGLNSIMAGHLYDIAEALGVPVEYLFDGLPPSPTLPPEREAKLVRASEFVTNTLRMGDKKRREHITKLTFSLGQEGAPTKMG